jgi:hypothetical protein
MRSHEGLEWMVFLAHGCESIGCLLSVFYGLLQFIEQSFNDDRGSIRL